ncbi:sperm-associated antigen 5 [Protopterus annectens]|uniref:sperm-associated antigen 5 n=1 Tax=Protopterus annectens TaxID=7888 RepID=UPI001CFB7BFA|nr:sperm-associated antigen 5 [Protopterus annectens]
MELERSQLQDEKDACCTELNSRDDSMKLMESRLAEEMSKLEQAQKENEILNLQVSDLEKQQDYLKNLLQQQDEQSYQISWQQNQCTAMAEKIEFLEYENQLHLEHLADMESKMKTNLYSLRERNVQCEELKKQASQLQRERDALQEELDCTKAEARFMLLKLGREMRNCSLELSKIKEKLQDLISSVQTNTQKDLCLEEKPLDTPAAKNRSFVASVLEAFTGQQMVEETEIANDTQEDHPSSLGSEKSAFTRVEPTTPKREPEAEQSLWTSVTDLDETVANLLVIVCQSQEKKEFEIQKLHHEMSLLQEEQQNIDIQHSSEVKSLQIQIEDLEHTNQKFNDMLEKNESLQEELEQLKHALGKAELDAKKLHEEQERSRDSNTVPEHSDLVQEAVGLKQEVNKLKKLLSECETSKSEILARACRHRKIQDENIRKTEEELQKLDSIIERVRETLMCIPNVVAGCKELQTLLEFIG